MHILEHKLVDVGLIVKTSTQACSMGARRNFSREGQKLIFYSQISVSTPKFGTGSGGATPGNFPKFYIAVYEF